MKNIQYSKRKIGHRILDIGYSSEVGQSLFEVVVSLGITTLVILALVTLVSVSIRNANFSKDTTLATRHAQEATEWLRGERDAGWENFINRAATPVWCLPVLSWSSATAGNCSESALIPNTAFRREVTLAVVNPSNVEAKVSVYWEDSRGLHEAKSVTNFTNWKAR